MEARDTILKISVQLKTNMINGLDNFSLIFEERTYESEGI